MPPEGTALSPELRGLSARSLSTTVGLDLRYNSKTQLQLSGPTFLRRIAERRWRSGDQGQVLTGARLRRFLNRPDFDDLWELRSKLLFDPDLQRCLRARATLT
jgi:hypothetical protein